LNNPSNEIIRHDHTMDKRDTLREISHGISRPNNIDERDALHEIKIGKHCHGDRHAQPTTSAAVVTSSKAEKTNPPPASSGEDPVQSTAPMQTALALNWLGVNATQSEVSPTTHQSGDLALALNWLGPGASPMQQSMQPVPVSHDEFLARRHAERIPREESDAKLTSVMASVPPITQNEEFLECRHTERIPSAGLEEKLTSSVMASVPIGPHDTATPSIKPIPAKTTKRKTHKDDEIVLLKKRVDKMQKRTQWLEENLQVERERSIQAATEHVIEVRMLMAQRDDLLR
jgi:hypothetical protein